MEMMKKILVVLLAFVFSGIQQFFAQNVNSTVLIPWKYKTSAQINATPIISDDVMYIGSFDSCFYAIDLKTGAEKWHYKTNNKIYTTAVLSEEILCFESGNVLYALDLQGDFKWKFILYEGTVLNQHDEWDYFRSSPIVSGTTVYIGSEKGLVFGVDLKTGSKVFQCQTPSADHTIETTPAIYDNKIYVGDWNGVFYVFDLSTGNLVWKYDTKNDNSYSGWVNAIVTDPLIVNDVVYFGGRNCNLYCLDAKTGDKKWKFHDPGDMWMLGGPTISDGVLYIGSSYQHVVRAFNAVTGTLLWTSPVVYRVNSKPLIDGDYVFAGTEHDTNLKLGSVCVINKSTGKVISAQEMGTQIYSTPIINNGKMYFGATDGYIYAINKQVLTDVPILDLKTTTSIQLGQTINTVGIDTCIYVYNSGKSADSVSITTARAEISIIPSSFVLPANDSVKITIRLNPNSLAPQRYASNTNFNSLWSIPPSTIKKYILFEIISATDVDKSQKKNESFSLEQNYPNPFNPVTKIKYSIPSEGTRHGVFVRLKIYDILGNEIATLINEEQKPGDYEVNFNAGNLNSGIYMYKLQVGDYINVKKMILIK